MNAESLLVTIARMFGQHNLEAILVGNAAAALHGAPVTTLDVDFMFRKTPQNLKKLKAIAKDLEAVILRPYYPASELFRLTRDRDGYEKYLRKSRTITAKKKRKSVKKKQTRKRKDALRKESDRALIEQIHRLLALPMNKRTNFLRIRRPGGGSHL